jgi:UDP-N-acetylmuramate dehydrogenase
MRPVDIQRNTPLLSLNTFGLPASAAWFTRVRTGDELAEALALARREGLAVTPLGGGSNLVLAGDVEGLVVQVALPGFDVLQDGPGGALVRVGAGEDWPALVDRTLEAGLFGLENLALIPGTAGAAPIQNVGAYGVEVREALQSLEAVERDTGRARAFDNRECAFGYRDSVFKNVERDRWVVTSITLRLSREPVVRLSYGALAAELEARGVDRPGPRDVAEAVRHLRRTRLPDPAVTGNAGSFFQNPVVEAPVADRLVRDHPALPTWPVPGGRVKLAAAWLIEDCGFKGARRGAAGIHGAHALVLVNLGGATGREVLALAREVREAVRARFGVDLQVEPRILGGEAGAGLSPWQP